MKDQVTDRTIIRIKTEITVTTSLKASVVLMLYNAVESTVTKSLERMHEILIHKNLKFDDCNENLKELVAVYYEKAKDKSPNIHNKIPFILRFYDYIRSMHSFELSYKELSKFYSLYSGNLDSKSIISILGKYGVGFQEKTSELRTIKKNRNSLAHGEQTFEEVGRDLPTPQLESMKVKTFEYLEKMIDVIEKYINNEEFRA
jgi:hypothetical protein